jgi:hypothetical protein
MRRLRGDRCRGPRSAREKEDNQRCEHYSCGADDSPPRSSHSSFSAGCGECVRE